MSNDKTVPVSKTAQTDTNISFLEDDKHGLITISGPPGCGATTLASELADTLDYTYINGGQMFRDLAEDRNMSLQKLLERADSDDTLDRSLDARVQRIIDQHDFEADGLIIESRLAGWVAGSDADMKIWLDAPTDVRIERTKYRSNGEFTLREREASEAERYEDYYDIDLSDTQFYDLHINTARWCPESTIALVKYALDCYTERNDEGSFTKSFDPDPPTN